MAETSGFFEAKVNVETNEYDRVYYASQFARYFSLFIGNGVFAATSKQLLVESVSGMRIKVNPGWGFIEGYWYNNDKDLFIDIPVNTLTVARTDIVVLRRDETVRDIHIVYLESETEIRRDGGYYDLLLAEIIVPVGSASISNANITDKRSDQRVCGFVKGLVDVITTDALFNQFTAQFNEWFDTIKGQLTDDAAGKLTADFIELRSDFVEHTLTFTNLSVSTSAWLSSGDSKFPYYANVSCIGVTADYVPTVNFSLADATSGNYAGVSESGNGVVKIYAKAKPSSTVTIPTIQCIKSV